jgi:hypothetical protein
MKHALARAMSTSSRASDAPVSTADRMRAQRETIQATWMGWVRRELAAAADQSDSALLDNMPKIIDALAQVLDGGEGGTAYSQELFALHAEARVDWSSYSADEILREYVLLRKAVFQVLESQQPLSGAERDTILEFIDRGVLAGSARITAFQRVQAQIELQYPELVRRRSSTASSASALRVARRPL